ncbi:MAG: type IV pilus assembly protein PilM [Parcubacteria group bacterium]|nr:type IV pilus assembly protein PilM [Parcubacteria group bacterium]
MILINGSNSPVGLDISDLSIKLVQLGKRRDKIKIQALSKSALPQGVIVNGKIKDKTELIKAIRKIIANPLYGKISSEEIVACLPESKTFIKLIAVQKSPNPLADMIGSEIEKHVPLELNEIYYDWQIIEELADKYLVLIGAAPKDIINQYTQMLDEAKLSPLALEIEPIAICRSLLKEELAAAKTSASQNYGIIDLGASHTSMIFYSGGTILFTVSIPVSGEEITAKISLALNLTKEQAEKAKIICGLDENKANGVIKNILAETLKNLTEKIKEAISFYENYFKQRGPLNRILLCGGSANIPDLEKIISQELAVEVKPANTLTNLTEVKDEFTEIFRKNHTSSAAFATALGLALRGIFIDEL